MAESEENVVIKAGQCAVTLMPALGGKISSLRVGNEELLQAPLKPYAPSTKTMAFSDGDASGWDECLPSVAECGVQTDAGPAHVPDHGDLWRVPWQVLNASEDSATLRANCFSLPLQLMRSAILTEVASGWRLQLLYSLTNLGACNVPWAWSAHPLFVVSAGDRIVLPNDVHTLRVEGSAGNRLGTAQSGANTASWPLTRSKDGEDIDLSVAASPDSGIGGQAPLPEHSLRSGKAGACSNARQIGLRITVRFELSLTPYLGLWLCYGGWPNGPGPKQVCVALEPATAPVDSLATTGAWSRQLDPGETFTWPMELQIDRIEPGKEPCKEPGKSNGLHGTHG